MPQTFLRMLLCTWQAFFLPDPKMYGSKSALGTLNSLMFRLLQVAIHVFEGFKVLAYDVFRDLRGERADPEMCD